MADAASGLIDAGNQPAIGTPEVHDEPPLRRATPAEAQRLGVVLANAFLEDPIFGWLIPSEHRRRSSLARFFEIQLKVLGIAQGSVWTNDELTGAAICTPPGRWRFHEADALRHGVGLARTFGLLLPRAGAFLQLVESRHVREPHHYIAYLGVEPDVQGQGLGASLLRPTLETCDREQLPAYIEATTERSAKLYERLGFVLRSEVTLRKSPPLRLLLRQPLPPA